MDLQSRMWSCASMESALAAMNLPDSKDELEQCIKDTFSPSSPFKSCRKKCFRLKLTSTFWGDAHIFVYCCFPDRKCLRRSNRLRPWQQPSLKLKPSQVICPLTRWIPIPLRWKLTKTHTSWMTRTHTSWMVDLTTLPSISMMSYLTYRCLCFVVRYTFLQRQYSKSWNKYTVGSPKEGYLFLCIESLYLGI